MWPIKALGTPVHAVDWTGCQRPPIPKPFDSYFKHDSNWMVVWLPYPCQHICMVITNIYWALPADLVLDTLDIDSRNPHHHPGSWEAGLFPFSRWGPNREGIRNKVPQPSVKVGFGFQNPVPQPCKLLTLCYLWRRANSERQWSYKKPSRWSLHRTGLQIPT